MAGCGPLTITGWQTVLLVVVLALIILVYGELCARDAARRTRDELWVEGTESDELDCEPLADEAATGPIELDEERPSKHGRHSRGHEF